MGARIASAEIARNFLWQLLMISPGLIAVRMIAPSTPLQVPITALAIPIPWLQARVAGGSASTAVLAVAIAAAGQVVVPAYGANPIIWPGLLFMLGNFRQIWTSITTLRNFLIHRTGYGR